MSAAIPCGRGQYFVRWSEFRIYSDDHEPAHAHGLYGSTAIVVEFSNPEEIGVRAGSMQPPNAKRSDVRKIVDKAVEHYDELRAM